MIMAGTSLTVHDVARRANFTPEQHLARTPAGHAWKPGTTDASKAGQAAVVVASDRWCDTWGEPLPGGIEGRLVKTAMRYVARDRKDPAFVVACAARIVEVAGVYSYAYYEAFGDDPLDGDLHTAAFAGVDLLIQGKAWDWVAEALEVAGKKGTRWVAEEYKKVAQAKNRKVPAKTGRYAFGDHPTQGEVMQNVIDHFHAQAKAWAQRTFDANGGCRLELRGVMEDVSPEAFKVYHQYDIHNERGGLFGPRNERDQADEIARAESAALKAMGRW